MTFSPEYVAHAARDGEKECAVCTAVAKRDNRLVPLQILNTKTQTWHGGGEYGVTDCGKGATREWWMWPL